MKKIPCTPPFKSFFNNGNMHLLLFCRHFGKTNPIVASDEVDQPLNRFFHYGKLCKDHRNTTSLYTNCLSTSNKPTKVNKCNQGNTHRYKPQGHDPEYTILSFQLDEEQFLDRYMDQFMNKTDEECEPTDRGFSQKLSRPDLDGQVMW